MSGGERAALGAAVLAGALLLPPFLIWAERRILALWQDRRGPNRVGPAGTLQVVADAIKLLFKEDWIPPFADPVPFVIAPALAAAAMLAAFAFIPVGPGTAVADLSAGLLLVLAAVSLDVYALVAAGYASDSKYPLLGGVRAAAQMLSYELFLGLSLLGVAMMAGSFRLGDIVEAQAGMWFCFPQAGGLALYTVAALALVHRLPFDLPEAESELVAGYHAEYSGMKFGLFFVGEYLGMALVCALGATLFFGGWRGPFLPPALWLLLKTLLLLGGVILLRASLPRPRIDQLMGLAWRTLLPLALANLFLTAGLVLAHGG